MKAAALAAAGMPFTPVPGGVRLAVRLTPRGGKDAVDGVSSGPDGRSLLMVRVSAPAVDGAANAALAGFLASALRLRKSAVAIQSGAGSRIKILHVAGDGAALCERLTAWIHGQAADAG